MGNGMISLMRKRQHKRTFQDMQFILATPPVTAFTHAVEVTLCHKGHERTLILQASQLTCHCCTLAHVSVLRSVTLLPAADPAAGMKQPLCVGVKEQL